MDKKEKMLDDSASDTKKSNSDKWGNQVEFCLSTLGYCVGLGNVYRFPYLVMRNGGAAFLVPYFFFLFLIGISIFVLEYYLGKFSGCSPVTVWNICPLFKGNAITINTISVLINILQLTVVSWCFVYMFYSFTTKVPWGTCGNPWNTPACIPSDYTPESRDVSVSYNQTAFYLRNETSGNYTPLATNSSSTTPEPLLPVSSSLEFFENKILGLSAGVHDMGNINLHTVLGDILGWFVVFVAVSKGVRSMGKMTYFTALSPYIMLGALVIRGVTLPGSWNGVLFYLIPDVKRLKDFNVWYEAALQIFFTLGPGWGGVLVMSSHCPYKGKFIRKGILLAIACCLTSFYGGFVTFSVLGFLAKQSGRNIEEVARAGPGLAFITYPEALAQMPLAPVWSFLFFCMLANVAIEGIFVETEVNVDSLMDVWPRLRKYRVLLAVVACVVLFIIGLPIAFGVGMYIFQLVDWYVFSQTTVLVTLTECIIVAHCYGFERVKKDIMDMTGEAPSLLWKISWGYISPLVLAFICVYSLVGMTEPNYGDYTYPRWAIWSVWMLTIGVMLPVPIMMLVVFFQQSGTPLQRIKTATSATNMWGPQSNYVKVSTSDTNEHAV